MPPSPISCSRSYGPIREPVRSGFSRRQFLGTTAAVGAGALLSSGSKVLGQTNVTAKAMDSKINVALIGFGAEGRADNTIFVREREDFPIFDNCVSALVEDLHLRGLADDCSVIIMGEFGRTPRISGQIGRDHWPNVNCALMAGGGMTTGQVIGSTDKIAGEAASRPVTFGELFATLYHNLGIEPDKATLTDLTGRPQYLVEDDAPPMKELV